MYIHLHAHSSIASKGDSILDLKEYVEKIKEHGSTACAITNHGSLADMYQFYNICKNNEVKPIIGNEVYLKLMHDKNHKDIFGKERYHLVLLAKNNDGIKNLIFLATESAVNDFYRHPLTDIEKLKKHSKGLIALSACRGGLIPFLILNNKMNEALKVAKIFNNIFEHFYLEVQPGNVEQEKVNKGILFISKKLNIPYVITNDVHYLNNEDCYIHNSHIIISRKEEREINDLIYKDNCYCVMKENELYAPGLSQKELQLAVNNTNNIADLCDIKLQTYPDMPVFSDDPSFDSTKYLKELLYNKLSQLYSILDNPSTYTDRLNYEISVIEKLGFVDYFLIVYDIIDYAKKNGIPVGPGRGSVGGSLCAYLLGITIADPIKYNLIFERFLSEYRVGTIPDIDLDFSSDDRPKMFEYIKNKYGKDRVCLLSTTMMRKAKTAIKDAAKIFDIKEGHQIANLVPDFYYDDEGEKEDKISLARAIELEPKLQAYQRKYEEMFKYALALDNMPRNDGKHASGVIISRYSIMDRIPLRNSEEGDLYLAALDLKSVENIAVKFDFLSLNMLSVIENTQAKVGYLNYQEEGFFEDEEVWNTISDKVTTGIFQIASYIYKKRMHRIKPKNLIELAACIALIRGPSLAAKIKVGKDTIKMDELYMQICEGKKDILKIHPFYDEPTKETNGVLIYQEQIMDILQNFGFSNEDSFRIMKLTTKAKNKALVDAKQEEFYKLADERKVPKQKAIQIWHLVEESSKYCFNKAHALCYAMLVYISAYLKTYHTKTYFTELLTAVYVKKNEDKIIETVKEVKRYGYKIVFPDINCCSYQFQSCDEDIIMAGTCSLKNFGKAIDKLEIIQGNITDVKDILVLGKKAGTAAILGGMMDFTNKSREEMYKEFLELRKDKVDLVYVDTKKKKHKIKSCQRQIEKAIYTINF